MARRSLCAQTVAGIIEHIRRKRLSAGEHLPAQTLADALRVSRAPVRAALKRMEEQGIVRLEANRGYFLAKEANEIDRAAEAVDDPAEPEDELYAELVAGCLSGKLDSKVSETELMRIHGVPRSRLLKTLNRIQMEGWATRRPGSGWEFLPRIMSRVSYEEAYRFRAAVETQALLLPSFRIDADGFARARDEQASLLKGGFQQMSRAQIFEANSWFHEMLIACGRNEFFCEALNRVNRLRRLLEYRGTVDKSYQTLQAREHLLILDIIESGERERAAEYLRAHIMGAWAIKSPTIVP